MRTARKSDSNISLQLYGSNTGKDFKGRSYAQNLMSEVKAVLEMSTVHLDTVWKTTTPLMHKAMLEMSTVHLDTVWKTTTPLMHKAVLTEMSTVHLDTVWKTTTPLMHSCSSDSVMQLGPLGAGHPDQWCTFCTPSFALRSTHRRFKSGEFGGHSSSEMNSSISLSRNSMVVWAFWWRQLRLSLRSAVQVVLVLFIFFQLL